MPERPSSSSRPVRSGLRSTPASPGRSAPNRASGNGAKRAGDNGPSRVSGRSSAPRDGQASVGEPPRRRGSATGATGRPAGRVDRDSVGSSGRRPGGRPTSAPGWRSKGDSGSRPARVDRYGRALPAAVERPSSVDRDRPVRSGPGAGAARRGPSRGDERPVRSGPGAGAARRGPARPPGSADRPPLQGARPDRAPRSGERVSSGARPASAVRRAAGSSSVTSTRGASRRAPSSPGDPAADAPRSWGSVARRGTRTVREEPRPQGTEPPGRGGRSTSAGRRGDTGGERRRAEAIEHALGGAAESSTTVAHPRPDKPRVATLPPRPPTGVEGLKSRKVSKGANAVILRQTLPPRPRKVEDLTVAFTRVLGASAAGKARSDLDAAARAYEHDRFTESLRLTARLTQLAPGVAEVRELHGLSLYRLGRWSAAVVQLEAFRELAGSAEQNAVLADCHRALRRWSDVDELWDELRSSSPNPAVVNEGRIVMAGALADRGDLAAALRLIEKGWHVPARPQGHHLRRAYAMADLYERSGSPVRARELFGWVRGMDGEFADVADRLRQLG